MVVADTTATERRDPTPTEGAGGKMGDYWEYVKNAYTSGGSMFGPGWGLLQAGYDMLYDNSHGDDRYWLSKFPLFSWNRKLRDEAQEAEDRYRNTGIDEKYIDRVKGFDGSIAGGSAGALSVSRMHGSLSEMYTPEVVEDLSQKFNHMYG